MEQHSHRAQYSAQMSGLLKERRRGYAPYIVDGAEVENLERAVDGGEFPLGVAEVCIADAELF